MLCKTTLPPAASPAKQLANDTPGQRDGVGVMQPGMILALQNHLTTGCLARETIGK
ncbi:MAG: hypothetical protein M5U34_15835 [Chloroflexi bacterium]|nr:hypothetical protein [Chloroflexota bacterium]